MIWLILNQSQMEVNHAWIPAQGLDSTSRPVPSMKTVLNLKFQSGFPKNPLKIIQEVDFSAQSSGCCTNESVESRSNYSKRGL